MFLMFSMLVFNVYTCLSMFVNAFHMCFSTSVVPIPLVGGARGDEIQLHETLETPKPNIAIFLTNPMKYTRSCYIISLFPTEPLEPPETRMNNVERIDEPSETHRRISLCV